MNDYQNKTIYIVDDDALAAGHIRQFLEPTGANITLFSDSQAALDQALKTPPDCIISDLMMPGLDGYELCIKVRQADGLKKVKILIASAKSFDFDQRRAIQVGANGFIAKPVARENLLSELNRILDPKLTYSYWGVHGTLPVSGPDFVRYGGNTSCVSLSMPDKSNVIFDAGSGIKNLGDHLLAQGGRIRAKIFISHPHWDHINALPFFAPLYLQGNVIEILGPYHGDVSMRDLAAAQMDSLYFPVTMEEFSATVSFQDLREETIEMGEATLATMLLSHPGNCLGYRLTYEDKIFCYITDNEMFMEDSPYRNEHYVQRLSSFVEGADVLITDTTYRDEDYKFKIGWGHSSVSQVADLAARAKVKELHLFHHDPNDRDDLIDIKLSEVAAKLEELESDVKVLAPREGDTFTLT